jgi:hypothetical protein
VADDTMTRKPEWLRKRFSHNDNTAFTAGAIGDLRLNTVCSEAMCPNYTDCFSRRTATFMILGTNCTRDCAFCNVTHGTPSGVDGDEPSRLRHAGVFQGQPDSFGHLCSQKTRELLLVIEAHALRRQPKLKTKRVIPRDKRFKPAMTRILATAILGAEFP